MDDDEDRYLDDERLYHIQPLAYWQSERAKHLFKIKDFELEDAQRHPQGIIREDVDHVLVIQQDAKRYIQSEAAKGNVSEVLKRHDANIKRSRQ